jgi:hypothetical protein
MAWCTVVVHSLVSPVMGVVAVEARLAMADPALFREYQVSLMAWMHHCGGVAQSNAALWNLAA